MPDFAPICSAILYYSILLLPQTSPAISTMLAYSSSPSLMASTAPLDDFRSVLDFCFDLDMELDLQFPSLTTHSLPPEYQLASPQPQSQDLFTRWSNYWWPRPPRLRLRLILKSRTNRNFHTEVLNAQQADAEELEVFCARLESLIATPGDMAHLHRERVRQLANYYGPGNFV